MNKFFLRTVLIIFFISGGTLLFGDESRPSYEAGPIITSSNGLSGKEKESLQRQYEYQIRQKDLIANPYSSGASTPPPSLYSPDRGSEQEKLYRYFGIAVQLYKEGRLEEAAEIFKYIYIKNPDDKYVKGYLTRVQKDIEAQKKEFKIEGKIQAGRFKRNKIEHLIKDGVIYYETKDFDRALLKFADVLAIDPNNATAQKYMAELKKFYSQEITVENILQNAKDNEIKNASEKLLDKQKSEYAKLDEKALDLLDSIEKDKRYNINNREEALLDDAEMKKLLLDKKADIFLNNTEMDSHIKEIINARQLEEEKSLEFTLGPGDAVQISVQDHPELSGKVAVQLSGDIILPLVNETIMAKGLTTNELTEKVAERLKRYVQNPIVSITIVDYRSKVFYVIDENACTPYPITRAYLTLRDALFIADWGNNRALGRVLVIKPSTYKPIIRKIDAFDIIFRGNLENNIRIEDGDVIYIPMTVMAKVTKTLFDSSAPFRAIRLARDEFLGAKFNEKDWSAFLRMPKDYDHESREVQSLNNNNNDLTNLIFYDMIKR